MSTTATQTTQGMPKRATSSLPGTNMLINSTTKRITKASPDDISKTLVILSLYLFVFISHLKYKRLQQRCSPINTQEVSCLFFFYKGANIFRCPMVVYSLVYVYHKPKPLFSVRYVITNVCLVTIRFISMIL